MADEPAEQNLTPEQAAERERLAQARLWLQQADADLVAARDNIKCPKFITDYIEILRARFSVQTVILFGSRARGVHDQFSDWDLFVIASHLAGWKERLKDIWKDKPPGVDVIAWTPDEVRRYIYRTFILDIATEGVPLYGDMTWMRELAAQHRARQKTVQPEKEGRPAAAQL